MNRARILQNFMTFANKIVKKKKLILFDSYPAYRVIRKTDNFKKGNSHSCLLSD